MFVVATSSDKCPSSYVLVPQEIRRRYGIDIGDSLVFNSSKGKIQLKVERAFLSDIDIHGDSCIFLSKNNFLLKDKGEIAIQKHKLTIGGDPEFFLIHRKTKRVIEAYRYLNFSSNIGSDGDLAELRPMYGNTPTEFLNNLKQLVSKLKVRFPVTIKPHASSWYNNRSAGFHVHLGLPEELLLIAIEDTKHIIDNIVRALDFFVAVPAACIDTDDTRRLHCKQYGNPGDYRLNSRTLEYRTIGGYFLTSPIHASFIYNSAYTVISRILNDLAVDSNGWLNLHSIANYDYMREKYNMPEENKIISLLHSNRKQLLDLIPSIVAFSGQKQTMLDMLNENVQQYTFPQSWY